MSNEIASIVKAVDVLNYLKNKPYQFTANQIAEGIHINRTTVHRILKTLISVHMVSKNEESNMYRIAYKAYEIGMTYQSSLDPGKEIRNELRILGKELGINVGYAIKRNMTVVSLYEINEFTKVKFGYTEGTEYSLVRGVTGKTVMAYHEPFSEVEALISNIELISKTPNTPMDHKTIIEDMACIRENGYGISDGENILGFVGIAVPVFDQNNKIHGCVTSVAVKDGLADEDYQNIIEKAKKCAHNITRII